MGKNLKETTDELEIEVKEPTDRYEFIESVSISGEIYQKGSFIELTKDQLELFSPYVTSCLSVCKAKGDCVRC